MELTLRLRSLVRVVVGLARQILNLLTSEATIGVEHRILVCSVSQHALFLAVHAFPFIDPLLDACGWLASIASDTQVGTSIGPDHACGALVGATVVDHLGCRQAWTLAVHAHVLGAVRRLTIGDSYGIDIRLTRAHGTPVEVCTITLALCLSYKLFFEFLIRQMLLVLRA